ncbi:MAG: methyltransferase family protein [Chloroflexota bacterium]
MNAQRNVVTSRPEGTARALASVVVLSLVYLAAIFATAGRLDWLQGWALFVVFTVGSPLSRLFVARRYPDLVAERANFDEKAGIKGWDKVLMPLVAIVGPLATVVVAGLDQRFVWTQAFPPALAVVALAVLVLSMALGTWAMLANRFFAAVVRIQTDRGHQVATGGPYAYVRHPGYAAGALGTLAIPLALGSWWGLLVAAGVVALYVARTALEDATLQAELPGYADYAHRTRYRLLPGVW